MVTSQDIESIKTTALEKTFQPILRCASNERSHNQNTNDRGGDCTDMIIPLTSVPFQKPSVSSTELERNEPGSPPNIAMAPAKVDLWGVAETLQEVHTVCTRGFFSSSFIGTANDEDIIQPAYQINDTEILLCSRCAALFDSSLISSEHMNLCSFSCGSDRAIEMGLSCPNAKDILMTEVQTFLHFKSVPVFLFMKRRLMKEALRLQLMHSTLHAHTRSIMLLNMELEGKEFFRSKLISGVRVIDIIEDRSRQNRARTFIDYDKVTEYTEEYRHENGGTCC